MQIKPRPGVVNYHRNGNYVSGCWLSIQRGAIRLVWGDDISLQTRDLERQAVESIHRLFQELSPPSDWAAPRDSGEAWEDLRPVPWIVAFMELMHLDVARRYDCFDVCVPAHLVPWWKELPGVEVVSAIRRVD
jgi:hypothetical protein